MGASPYPPIARWTIPQSALEATVLGIQAGGRRGVEAGALWLGTRTTNPAVQAVVLPTGRGVTEALGRWVVSPEVLGVVTTWAASRTFALLGIAHGHSGSWVGMSPTDRAHLVHAPGILAVIVGDGGFEQNPSTWGWHVFEGSSYRELNEREREDRVLVATAGTCMVVQASLDGLRMVGP